MFLALAMFLLLAINLLVLDCMHLIECDDTFNGGGVLTLAKGQSEKANLEGNNRARFTYYWHVGNDKNKEGWYIEGSYKEILRQNVSWSINGNGEFESHVFVDQTNIDQSLMEEATNRSFFRTFPVNQQAFSYIDSDGNEQVKINPFWAASKGREQGIIPMGSPYEMALTLRGVFSLLPTTAAKSTLEAAKASTQFTKSSLKLGQQIHKAYHTGKVGKEFRLLSGRRIDYLDIKNGIIYELKPNNPRAILQGQKQLLMYLQELQSPAMLQKYPQFKGIQWKTVLDTY